METVLYVLVYGTIGVMIISSLVIRSYSLYLYRMTNGYNPQNEANRYLSIAPGVLLILSLAGKPAAFYLIIPVLIIMIYINLKELDLKHAVTFSLVHLFSSSGLVIFYTLIFVFSFVASMVISGATPVHYGYNPFGEPKYILNAQMRSKMETEESIRNLQEELIDRVMK